MFFFPLSSSSSSLVFFPFFVFFAVFFFIFQSFSVNVSLFIFSFVCLICSFFVHFGREKGNKTLCREKKERAHFHFRFLRVRGHGGRERPRSQQQRARGGPEGESVQQLQQRSQGHGAALMPRKVLGGEEQGRGCVVEVRRGEGGGGGRESRRRRFRRRCCAQSFLSLVSPLSLSLSLLSRPRPSSIFSPLFHFWKSKKTRKSLTLLPISAALFLHSNNAHSRLQPRHEACAARGV